MPFMAGPSRRRGFIREKGRRSSRDTLLTALTRIGHAHKLMRMAKKAVNLSVDVGLLAQAKAADVNLSALFEAALSKTVKERMESRWRAENQKAIEAYNEFVEENGIFGEDLRSF